MFTFRLDVAEHSVLLATSQRKPADDAAALELSIVKWESVVQYHQSPAGRALAAQAVWLEDDGPMTCGLCMLYYDEQCVGCPIARRTGHALCLGTPYQKYVHARTLARSNETLLRHAKAELAFLKSLRGTEGTQGRSPAATRCSCPAITALPRSLRQ